MEELEKQLMQSQIEVQEATFTALGKELHDNVGQLLSSSKMLLGITIKNSDTTPDTLRTAYETLSSAIVELRSLSRSLDKEWLQQFNLIENLNNEVARNNSVNDLKIHFTHPATIPLVADEQVVLFRILQEAMQNAIKHAEAKNIFINIEEGPGFIDITVGDDGRGFDNQGTNVGGAGMNNIRKRSRALGGTVSWLSADTGTTVAIKLPVKNENV